MLSSTVVTTTTTITTTMPYTINHKPSDYFCMCGAIVKASSVQKHLLTAKHQRDVVGCENIEAVALMTMSFICSCRNKK